MRYRSEEATVKRMAKRFIVRAFADREFYSVEGLRYRIAKVLRVWLGQEFRIL